jgi:RbsD / FucU transport protein family
MKKIILAVSLAALIFTAHAARAQAPNPETATDWRIKLNQELPLLGHRNWIMIVDSAYPLQVSPGVETIETGADLPQVLRVVLGTLDHSIHVTPNVFLDAELPYVTDEAAPGASVYRQHLKEILHDRPVKSLPHETLIKQINDAGQTFHILVLKTNMAIPYTSVFLQLDCKYWPPAAEQQLRQAMRNGSGAQ